MSVYEQTYYQLKRQPPSKRQHSRQDSPDLANPVKKAVLLMATEGNGLEESVYWYERLTKHLGWKDCEKVLCGVIRFWKTRFILSNPETSSQKISSSLPSISETVLRKYL